MRESVDRARPGSHRMCVRCWCTYGTLDVFRHISCAGTYKEQKPDEPFYSALAGLGGFLLASLTTSGHFGSTLTRAFLGQSRFLDLVLRSHGGHNSNYLLWTNSASMQRRH